MFLQVPTSQPGVQPDTLGFIGALPLTNAMLMAVLVTVLIFGISVHVKKKTKLSNCCYRNEGR